MKKQFTENLADWSSSSGWYGRKLRGITLLLLSSFLLSFSAFAQSEVGTSNHDTYRYLRLTVLGGISNKVTIEEIKWMDGPVAYPQINASSGSNNVTTSQKQLQSSAWRAYDGTTNSSSSAWNPNSKVYPYSITIDLGSENAISPTGIQIAIESSSKALSGFTCEGSNNLATWTHFLTKRGLTEADWTSNSFNTFEFPDTEAPSSPTGLTTSDITPSSFTLSWTAASDNIGVVSYEVFAGSESKGTTTSTSMNLSDLTCGTSYAMSVKAIDAAGNASAASAPIAVSTSECPDTEAPSVPSGLVSSDITATGFTISWDASTDDRGVAFYEVFAGSESKGMTTATSMALTDLDCGTSYSMTVKAADAAGNASAASAPLAVETTQCPDTEAPGVPANLSASDITRDSFTLAWDASTDNVGVTSYEVFAGSESKGTTTSTSMILSGLNCGNSYTMSVKASDAAGNTSEASSALAVETTECEGPVTDGYRYLRLTSLGGTTTYSVTLVEIDWMVGSEAYPKTRTTSASTNVTATAGQTTAWKAYDGVYGLAAAWSTQTTQYPYSITLDLGEGEAVVPTAIAIGIEWNGRAMSAFTCEGSADGTTWTNLYSASGLTDRSWTRDAVNTFVFPTTGDTEAPTSPSGLSATDITADSFTLSWDAATDNTGVTSYEVFAGGESKGTTTSTSMMVSGLDCATTYGMTVKAADAAGNVSEASAAVSVQTSSCEASANLISNGEFDNGTNGWTSVFQGGAAGGGSFAVVTDAGMSGANAGKINITNGGSAEWNVELHTLFNLEAGKTYEVSFKAKAAADRSALVIFQKGSDPYTHYWESTVNLTTTTQDFGPFTWTSNISDPATRLNFKVGGSNEDIWLDAITVKEVASSGDAEAPTAPSNLTTSNITETGLTLSWNASSDNVGVTSYEVFAGLISKGTTSGTSMDLTGLTCSTNFTFTVKAKDAAGNVSAASTSTNATTAACSGSSPANNASIGMNLSSVRSWNTEHYFTNLAHHALAWMPVETAPNFGTRIPKTELTAEGYLQPGAIGRLTIFWDAPSTVINTGDYVFTYEGTATVALSTYSTRTVTEVSNEAGRIVVNIAPSSGGNTFLYFDVTENSSTDPIKNIRFTEIDKENSTDVFRPEFVSDYASLKAFRFMDWMQTNNNNMVSWEDYPVDNALFQSGGVSFNYMIALANQTNMDAWFCTPVLADDDFFRQMAIKIRDNLKPELKAYIELSNEIWNGGFAQHRQAAEKARERSISNTGNNWEDAPAFTGYRSAEMEIIFKEEFAKSQTAPKLITVIGWQSANDWHFRNWVIPHYRKVLGAEASPQAVAIAPYFGGSIGSSANAAIVETWTVDQVFDQLINNTYGDQLAGSAITIERAFNQMRTYKATADRLNIPLLLGYEGGQHIVAPGGNTTIMNLFNDVNYDRQMYDLYIAYFDAWREIGGDLFVNFASTARWGRSGYWGWKQYPSETREQAPKYDAILTWNSNNQLAPASTSLMKMSNIGISEISSENNIMIYPNPVDNGSLTIKFDKQKENRLIIHNPNGKVVVDEIVNQEIKSLNLDNYKSGMYFFKINGHSKKVIIR